MTFDEAAILKICKYADDMWLKVMEVINNVPLVLVEESLDDKDIVEYIGDGLYTTQNAGSGNDEQLSLLIKKYNNCNLQDMNDTLLKRILKNDAMRMRDVKNAQYADEKQRIDAMMLKWEKYDKLIIYGAGYIAGLVFEEMLSYNLHKRIKVFAVCSTADNPSSYYGVKVDAYTNYIEDDSMIVLGVSKEKQIAVSRQLMNAGVGKERIIKLTGQEIKALKDSSKLCRNK